MSNYHEDMTPEEIRLEAETDIAGYLAATLEKIETYITLEQGVPSYKARYYRRQMRKLEAILDQINETIDQPN